MKTKWIVLANASATYIYAVNGKNSIDAVELITKLEHPESRKKNRELVTDRPGHYQTNHATRGSYSQHTDPKKIEMDNFAKEVADFLEQSNALGKYQSLIMIAGPNFYGLLMKHLHKPLHELIDKVIEKEIIINNEHELKKYISTIF